MIKKIVLTVALMIGVVSSYGLQLPEPMQPVRLVNDFVGMFTPQQQSQLEQKLVAFDKETSTQIAVVTIPDLEDAAISDYAQQLFDKWGVGGSSQKNNGILILLKPKSVSSKGEVFIATGYGVEGAVPDALAARIVDYEMIPSFKANNYFQGVDNAVNTLMSLTKGEFTADQYIKQKGGSSSGVLIGLILLIVVIGFFAKSSPSEQTYTSGGDIAKGIIIGSLLSGGHRGGGGFGGFSGGGGGFGGFGGGFSGGGGAGGSW